MMVPLLIVLSLAQQRLAVPDEAAQKEAEKLVRGVFKDDYARKSPSDRAALARRMLRQAQQSDDDPATRYVLLREARELAREAADWETSTQAIGALGKSFDTEIVSLKFALYVAMSRAAKSPEDFASTARRQLELSDEALVADQAEIASKAVAEASALAKKGKDIPLSMKADAKGKEVAERKSAQSKLASAVETLTRKPGDPEANLLVGRHYGLFQGDWPKALPLLSKGSDATLQAAAKKDLAAGDDPAAQVASGDAWWERAEKEPLAAARLQLRLRTLYWYERAEGSAEGVAKARITSRMTDIRLDRFPGTWVDMTDPRKFLAPGKAGDPIAVLAKEGVERFDLRNVTGDFDAVTVRVRLSEAKVVNAVIWLDRVTRGVQILHETLQATVFHVEPVRQIIKENVIAIPARSVYVLVVVLADGHYTAYLDGVEVGRFKTQVSRVLELGLQAEYAPVTYDEIRFRKKE